MRNADIIIGAFWRSTFFDDVHTELDKPYPPQSFTTGLDERFPASLLNDTQPNGFTSGTAGDEGINRQYMLTMVSEPIAQHPDPSVEETGINGNVVYARVRSVLSSLAISVKMPEYAPEHESYQQSWGDLKKLAASKPLIYVLHRSFAARGFISSAPALIMGETFDTSVPITLKFDYMFFPTVSGSNKLYDLFTFS